jgi:flagellin-like hook-associated protein FlgL
MRSNLLNLQSVSKQVATTQERLSTGRRVNSAVDDASAYFSAQTGFQKADDLSALKSAMGEGLQKIKAGLTATESATSTLKQMKSLADQALSTSDTNTKTNLMNQFNELRTQLTSITQNDAGYKGTNLLSGSDGNDLVINFNEDSTSSITIAATDTDAGSAYTPDAGSGWDTDNANISDSRDAVASAITSFNSLSSTLGSYSSFISTRLDFTSSLSNIFKSGAEDLVAADMNEEGANMLMLQTRQQLGVTSLSLSSQAAQGVLRLF